MEKATPTCAKIAPVWLRVHRADGSGPQFKTAMTQNHYSALMCVNLVKSSVALLGKITPATSESFQNLLRLAANLEELNIELQVALTRAARKQERREMREKMKKPLALEGGTQT